MPLRKRQPAPCSITTGFSVVRKPCTSERDLRIVTTREHGALTGVAPLVCESGGPGHHLVLLGASPAVRAERVVVFVACGTFRIDLRGAATRCAGDVAADSSSVRHAGRAGSAHSRSRIDDRSHDIPIARHRHSRFVGRVLFPNVAPHAGQPVEESCKRGACALVPVASRHWSRGHPTWLRCWRSLRTWNVRAGRGAADPRLHIAPTSRLLPELLPKSGGARPIAHYSTDLWVTGCRCRSLDRCLRPKVGPQDWVPR